MCWLYVPELADLNSGSELPIPERALSVTWKGKPMRQQNLLRVWKMGGFIRRLSGLTLPHSTLSRGVESFIASLRETPASQTVSPDSDGDKTMNGGSSTRYSTPSIACGLVVSSGKTSRGTLTGNSPPSSQHWKQWATALRQESSQRPKSAPATGESGCSSWPTATAVDGRRGVETDKDRVRRGAHTGTTLNDAASGWATPRATDGEKGGPNMSFGSGGGAPTSSDGGELAHTGNTGLQGSECGGTLGGRNGEEAPGSTPELRLPLFAPGPSDPTWREVVEHAPHLEPAICRVADGMANRVDRLRATGNGVCPLAAAYAWRTLEAVLQEEQ